MKTKNTLFALAFVCAALFANAQNGHWRTTGNPTGGLDGVLPPTTNFLGTDNTNPNWIKLGVTGSQDIFIDNMTAYPQILPNGAGTGNPEGGHWVGLGRIFQPSNGATLAPLAPHAHLHIHGGNNSQWADFTTGVRPWMQTGVLSTENSNGMYVGLKSIFGNPPTTYTNESYAVINWADDNSGGFPTDFLSFNFTNRYAAGNLTNTLDGMELGRFNPTQGQGTFGVGNFQILSPNTIYTDPVRRVEILDADPATGNIAFAPQLRLTTHYDPVAVAPAINLQPLLLPANQGTFSEFFSAFSGSLGIFATDYSQPHPVATSTLNQTQRFVGINTPTPLNTLEINSQYMPGNNTISAFGIQNGQPQVAPFGLPTGWAGLRFTDLTNGSVPEANQGPGILSVDKHGDVIYVPQVVIPPNLATGAQNGCSMSTIAPNTDVVLGQDLAQYSFVVAPASIINPAAFLNDRGVPMNTKSIIFSDGAATPFGYPAFARPNTISIGNGYNPFAPPNPNIATSKLFLFDSNTEGIGGLFAHYAGAGGQVVHLPNMYLPTVGATGVAGYTYGSGFDNRMTGVLGVAHNTSVTSSAIDIVGVRGEAIVTDGKALGVEGLALYNNNGLVGQNYGGYFEAGNANLSNIGVSGVVAGTVGAMNIGVQGIATAIANNWAGLFNGNVTIVGGSYIPSDSILKTNINPITNPISTIKQLQAKSFYFDTTNTVGLNFSSKKQYGFLAQNVQRVLPELVMPFYAPKDSTFNTPYSVLNYNAFIGLLTAGMQQQQGSIDSLRSTVFPLPPSAPVLISPANGAVGYFPKLLLTWNSAVSTSLVFYAVQVAKDAAFSSTSLVYSQGGIADTTVGVGLGCDTVNITYYWRVIAKNSIGASAWSQVFSFTDTAKCGFAPPPPIKKIAAVGFVSSSDSLFKTNVSPLTNSLTKVTQLKGVSYDWLHNNPKYVFDSTQQIGFIAQDVQKVVPQVVSKDVNGFLAVDYGRLTPVLVEAIKTMKAGYDTKFDSMQAQINRLTSIVNACCTSTTSRHASTAINTQDVELSDANIVVLNQNQPNPFAEQTTITYNIPQSAGAAQLLFYDVNGKQIQNVNITTKGKGQLNVYANDLTNGVYSYTLIVDGKIIDTKKMVKQQ